jgi:hypothetical protein
MQLQGDEMTLAYELCGCNIHSSTKNLLVIEGKLMVLGDENKRVKGQKQ